MLEELAAVAEPFVVAAPVGDVGEPGCQMLLCVADESGFGGEPQQGLDHREGDQLGVGELRYDSYGWSFGCPVGVFD